MASHSTARSAVRTLSLRMRSIHSFSSSTENSRFCEQPRDVGTFLLVSPCAPACGRWRRRKFGPKRRIAAGEVAHVEVRVHRMRRPGQEHDRLPGPVGPFDLREHALLARLDELEATEAELVLLDQVEDEVVAVVAGLDAVNRCPQLFSESIDVREVLEPRVVQIVGHAERVLRTDQVVADDFDGAFVGEGLQHRFLRRNPVAEEDVDVAVLHRLERDRHGKHGNHRLVAQVREHLAPARPSSRFPRSSRRRRAAPRGSWAGRRLPRQHFRGRVQP